MSAQEDEIRRLIGPLYDTGKRVARALALRNNPADDEAASTMGALMYRLSCVEAHNERVQSEFADAVDTITAQEIENERLRHEVARLEGRTIPSRRASR